MRPLAALSVVLCVLAFAGTATPGDKKTAGAFDAAKIIGNWTYVEGTKNGEKIDKTRLVGIVKIDKEAIHIPGEKDQHFVMGYKIDGSKTPAALDMAIKDAPMKELVGGKAAGIIALDGDTLKICYIHGEGRAKAFESTKENKAHYFVLKKAK